MDNCPLSEKTRYVISANRESKKNEHKTGKIKTGKSKVEKYSDQKPECAGEKVFVIWDYTSLRIGLTNSYIKITERKHQATAKQTNKQPSRSSMKLTIYRTVHILFNSFSNNTPMHNHFTCFIYFCSVVLTIYLFVNFIFSQRSHTQFPDGFAFFCYFRNRLLPLYITFFFVCFFCISSCIYLSFFVVRFCGSIHLRSHHQ